MKKFLKKILRKNNLKYIPLVIFSLILSVSIYINREFNSATFEQLLYTLNSAEGTSISAIYEGIIFTILLTIICTLIFSFIFYKAKKKYVLKTKIKNKSFNIQIYPFNILNNHFVISNIIIIVIMLIATNNNIGFSTYLNDQLNPSTLFDEHYVDPGKTKLTFPEEKRNLIYIFVESLESTNLSSKNGGTQKQSYIPELEEIALENINFSNDKNLGGALPVNGTGWTVSAMVAHTAGIPLKTTFGANDYKDRGSGFLPGAVSLGDILKENGYHNYLLIGSDAKFGNRNEYFEQHGEYEIHDYEYAKEMDLIPEDYFVWWGYEDKKLFDFAKTELTEISKNDEPFNFTMLTADTHFTDGYVDESCEEPFNNKYANSFNCSSSMIGKFISWIKKQDFYDNTTIVIAGDHLTMQTNFYNKISDKFYDRTIYNAFINADAKATNTKNRTFSSMDLFPTTLASLGVEIKGNRLGLGTNLFSNKKTVIEEMGYDKFSDEVSRKSEYYNNNILNKTVKK